MEIKEHRENPFPNDLEGRMNSILNVVNTELKTVTLLHLDDSPADMYEVKRRVRETVGNGIYLPGYKTFGGYCCKTLFPIGTVAEEVILDEGEVISTAYKLTEAGKKYGIPIAMFTLDYVFRTGKSLFENLGSTNSSGKSRAPLNRIKILEALKFKNQRIIDIKKVLGSADSLEHVEAMKSKGLVQYDSCGEFSLSGTVVNYLWIGKDIFEIKPIRHRREFTLEVAKKLKEIGRGGAIQILELLDYKGIKATCDVLSGLVSQGFAKRERWKGKELLSEVTITNEGRRFLEDYAERVRDALADGSELRKMQELSEQLSEERYKDYCRKAVRLYALISPHINQQPMEETQQKLIDYIKANPGRRPSEICKHFSLNNFGVYLTPLVRDGLLRKEKQGKAVRYYAIK